MPFGINYSPICFKMRTSGRQQTQAFCPLDENLILIKKLLSNTSNTAWPRTNYFDITVLLRDRGLFRSPLEVTGHEISPVLYPPRKKPRRASYLPSPRASKDLSTGSVIIIPSYQKSLTIAPLKANQSGSPEKPPQSKPSVE